jgi:hypothetical protein
MLTILAALAALLGAAVAVERSPKVEGPQVRETTEMERWQQTPVGQHVERILELIKQGRVQDARDADEAFKRERPELFPAPQEARPPQQPRELRGPRMMPENLRR